MTPAARSLATVLYLDQYRPPADLLAAPQTPDGGARWGKPPATTVRATLAVCWRRSQLRRDLIERGTGLLAGAVLLAVVLWVLSLMGAI